MANKVVSLSLKKDLKKIYKQGLVIKKGGVVLRCVGNKKGLRVAFGLSCKVIRTAVKRNKIKRWSRQILREAACLEKTSLDLLITIEKSQDCYETFKKNFDFLLEQLFRTKNSRSFSSLHCFL